ncbi:ABC transporter permease [Paenibacillus beijingensis]|uniref:ABC transporter permease n=1 Tax=Paenibacillus beijingensis TaxID=1126833 RepID=A0A0D5NFN1_9BACL|nr:ABC transporter permease [Paenibacillus beijingensis]AJY73960.1 hypothetical protein VN24_04195 [Paenibacillus beijingensis]
MFDFWQLVRNENMKLYRRIRTWIMLAFPVIGVLAVSLIANSVSSGQPSMWTMMLYESLVMLQLVTIFTVVVAADSVAGEFSAGTIKLLLIRPWSRSKILLSKYVSLLLFSLLSTVILFAAAVVINMIVFGYSGGQASAIADLGTNLNVGVWNYMLSYYALQWISMVVVITLAFMLSTVFRSNGLAIGLSLFIVLMGSTIATLLRAMMERYEWIEYIFLVHLNLTGYLSGAPGDNGMTFGFSLGVLAVYYVLFLAVTWTLFRKRDVAA